MKNLIGSTVLYALLILTITSCKEEEDLRKSNDFFLVGQLDDNIVLNTYDPEIKLTSFDRYQIDFDNDNQADFEFYNENLTGNIYTACFERSNSSRYSFIETLNPAIELLYFTQVDTIYNCHVEDMEAWTQVRDYYYNTDFDCSGNEKIDKIENKLVPSIFNLYDTLNLDGSWANNVFELAYSRYDNVVRSTWECPSSGISSSELTTITRENWNNKSMRYIVFRKKVNDSYIQGWIRLEVNNYNEITLYDVAYQLE